MKVQKILLTILCCLAPLVFGAGKSSSAEGGASAADSVEESLNERFLRVAMDRNLTTREGNRILSNEEKIKALYQLINSGADLNYRNPKNGMTALHYAALFRDYRLSYFLLHTEASPFVVDLLLRKPLDISEGYEDKVLMPSFINAMSDYAEKKNHVTLAYSEKPRDIKKLKKLIDSNPSLATKYDALSFPRPDGSGYKVIEINPVGAAAFGGKLKALKALAKRKQIDLNEPLIRGDREGETILSIASQSGHLHIVKYLVEVVKVDIHRGFSPLFSAVVGNKPDVIRYFVERAPEDKRFNPSEFLQADFSPEVKNRRFNLMIGHTPLSCSLFLCHDEAARVLISLGSDPMTIVQEGILKGFNNLYIAITQDVSFSLVKILLDLGVSPSQRINNEDSDYHNKSFFDVCLEEERLDVFYYIIADGVEEYYDNLDVQANMIQRQAKLFLEKKIVKKKG